MKGDVTIDLTREKATELILRQVMDTKVYVECCVDIFYADSLSEAMDMGESAEYGMPDLRQEAKDKYVEIQVKKKELESLALHELYEKGEDLGLWKLGERQKRLF